MELRGGTATIDGGPELPVLDVRQVPPEYEYVRSEGAVLPDPNWSATDSHGHTHRWTTAGQKDMAGRMTHDVLTLNRSTRHVECEGQCDLDDCEGYDVPVWLCRKCGDEVEPGYRPDWQARSTGLPMLMVGSFLDVTVDVTPALQRQPVIGVMPPSWGTVTLTTADGESTRGRGMLDMSGELVVGERPTAVVRFTTDL